MQERNIPSDKEGLRSLVTFIESVTPQLEEQFRDDSHKIRFLRDAVLGVPLAKFPLSLTIAIQFTFYNYVIALESSLVVHHQHMRKLPMTHYGKGLPSYTINPQDDWKVHPDGKLDGTSRDMNNNPIDKCMNLYANDLRYVRKLDYDRSRSRKSRSVLRLGSCSLYHSNNGYVSKVANNQRLNADRDSTEREFIACGQVGHVAADRRCKPTYSVIRKSLL